MKVYTAIPLLLMMGLGACAPRPPQMEVTRAAQPAPLPYVAPDKLALYQGMQDGDHWVEAVPRKYLTPDTVRQEVDYWTDEKPGTIIVDPWDKYLYLVEADNRAMRYAVAVGEAGRAFSGNAIIPYGREWPRWTPTPGMIRREPEKYEPLKAGMDGGPDNPLGARALYLHRDGKDTLYRIHGTPYPWSVGHAASSGCIRLYEQDIIDLYSRVSKGNTRVIVLTEAEAGKGTYPPGQEPARITSATLSDAPVSTLSGYSSTPAIEDGDSYQ